MGGLSVLALAKGLFLRLYARTGGRTLPSRVNVSMRL